MSVVRAQLKEPEGADPTTRFGCSTALAVQGTYREEVLNVYLLSRCIDNEEHLPDALALSKL